MMPGSELVPQQQLLHPPQQQHHQAYHVKLQLRGQLRRTQLPECTFAALQQAIRAMFPDFREGQFFYYDDDEDKIAFYSDVEVLSMFSFFKTKCNSDTAKIFVEEEPSPGQHGARANPKLEHNYFTRSTNRPAALQANVKMQAMFMHQNSSSSSSQSQQLQRPPIKRPFTLLKNQQQQQHPLKVGSGGGGSSSAVSSSRQSTPAKGKLANKEIDKQATPDTTGNPAHTFIASQRGGPKLLYEQYTYTGTRKKTNHGYWRCDLRDKWGCPGKVITKVDGTVVVTAEHTHPPDPRRTEIMLARHAIKEAAEATTFSAYSVRRRTGAIISQALDDIGVSQEVKNSMQRNALCKMMQRRRHAVKVRAMAQLEQEQQQQGGQEQPLTLEDMWTNAEDGQQQNGAGNENSKEMEDEEVDVDDDDNLEENEELPAAGDSSYQQHQQAGSSSNAHQQQKQQPAENNVGEEFDDEEVEEEEDEDDAFDLGLHGTVI